MSGLQELLLFLNLITIDTLMLSLGLYISMEYRSEVLFEESPKWYLKARGQAVLVSKFAFKMKCRDC